MTRSACLPVEPHAPSYYAATANDGNPYPSLTEARSCDVAIVGGGYTGVSSALHLAECGVDVVLLEANPIGWGASGRNGGQLHQGLRGDPRRLEQLFGRDDARALHHLSNSAGVLVKDLIARHKIDCDWRDGLIHALHKARYINDAKAELDYLRRTYDADHFDWLNKDALAAALGTPVYHAGYRDRAMGHLHALNYVLGLARAAREAGAQIFAQSRVTALGKENRRWRLTSPRGHVAADTVILACNGYMEGLFAPLEARITPINNYILTTEPLGSRQPIPGSEAVSDSRFVVYYWRPTVDNRLLFGGGETYARTFPPNIGSRVRKHMLRIYPQFSDVRIDYAWGGTLAVTMKRFACLRQLENGLYAAGGYSGQGIGMGTLAGKILADALTGNRGAFDLVARLPCPRFPGGKWLRWPLLVAAMSYYALRDRI